MSQQPTTPEEDQERNADEEVIDRIRRRRLLVKELKWGLILGLIMALAVLAALGRYAFHTIQDLPTAPASGYVRLTYFMMGWFLSAGYMGVGLIGGMILVDHRVKRLLLKYYDLTIDLEHRLELQQRTTDKHIT